MQLHVFYGMHGIKYVLPVCMLHIFAHRVDKPACMPNDTRMKVCVLTSMQVDYTYAGQVKLRTFLVVLRCDTIMYTKTSEPRSPQNHIQTVGL